MTRRPCRFLQRYRGITVKAQDETGAPLDLNLGEEWVARIFQHEFDHLQV
jgi:peptide deformylase